MGQRRPRDAPTTLTHFQRGRSTQPPALIVTPTQATPTRAAPIPLPTRQQDTAPWVEERVDAVVALYQPTRAGEALLRSLDLRQMEGDPGFFGS